MKPGIHPAYGPVVFRDTASGTARVLDTAGRVEKFQRRYGAR
ncbi:50S ribosomal protein L31 [Streptomyces sp. NPDC059708]